MAKETFDREARVEEIFGTIRRLLEELEPPELKRVRSMVNGKLGHRTINQDQQETMQKARRQKKLAK